MNDYCKDNPAMAPAMDRARDSARIAARMEATSNSDGDATSDNGVAKVNQLNVGCVPVARYIRDMVIWRYCQRQLVHESACNKAFLTCEFRPTP